MNKRLEKVLSEHNKYLKSLGWHPDQLKASREKRNKLEQAIAAQQYNDFIKAEGRKALESYRKGIRNDER